MTKEEIALKIELKVRKARKIKLNPDKYSWHDFMWAEGVVDMYNGDHSRKLGETESRFSMNYHMGRQEISELFAEAEKHVNT